MLAATACSILFLVGIILATRAKNTPTAPDDEPDVEAVTATVSETPARDEPRATEEARPHDEGPVSAVRAAVVEPAQTPAQPPVEQPTPPARAVTREAPPAPPAPAAQEPPPQAPPVQEPVAAPPARPVVAKSPRDTETFGTSVEFACTPAAAARQAREQQKLLFVLHVSGDFEESQFT